MILEIVRNYTGWPEVQSRASLTEASRLLRSVSPTDTIRTFLHRLLKSHRCSEDIKLALSWLLCSYRPLNIQEFAFVCNRRRPYEPSDQDDIGSQWLSVGLISRLPTGPSSVLRVLVDTEQEPVEIRGDVRDLLKHVPGADEYIWDEVRSTAHYTLFEFCANYLTSKHTVEKLEAVFSNYITRWKENQQEKKHTAHLACNNNDIVYYVIQALPYHMSKLSDSATALKRFCAHGGGRASAVWAKLYWAMSSLRPKNPPTSAQGVLGGLGLTPVAEVREEAIAKSSGLFVAAERGHWRAVSLLLQLRLDPNSSRGSPSDDYREWSPLAIACRNQWPKTMKALLQGGADPNILGPHGVDTPLWFCIIDEPNIQCVRCLVQFGADPNHENFSPPLLHEMVKSAHKVNTLVDICDIFLSGKGSMNINAAAADGETALMQACRTGKMPLVRWMLAKNANINAVNDSGQDAMKCAIWHGRLDIAAELLKHNPEGFNLSRLLPMIPLTLLDHSRAKLSDVEHGESLLHRAIDAPLEYLKILLEFRRDIDIDVLDFSKATAFHFASSCSNDLDVTSLILAQPEVKVNIAAPNYAFQGACFNAGVATINFLLDEGASVQHSDSLGRLPLHFAAVNGIENFIAVMLTYRGDMMATDKEEKTCLHWAAQFGNLQTVKFIIDHLNGANVDCEDSDGWTLLCWAARATKPADFGRMRSEKLDFLNVIRTLLQHGASPETICNLSDDEGTGTIQKTPLDLAWLPIIWVQNL
ncbi:ankyrin unc44 [Colletotrichum kahawae]|uniref:Ankyrin unc44 n=1 Tax=Colletotrichum kahawae TaxID=34407 RepID=A0AAE0CWP7_COLKA|nr:ankyrin unc44 [Colletotrichum kahawae]